MPLRIVFMGTPVFAVPTLAEILACGHEVAAAYTQPPRPAGRGMEPTKSPVHAFAETHGIAVRTLASLRGAEEQQAFAALEADVAVVVAYGLILPKPILAAPRQGCLNLHGSALPRWRGAAPIQRAIMAGDLTTAVMVMRMEEGLDTGPVCLGETLAIGADETAGELHDRMAFIGAKLMVRALSELQQGRLACTPQAREGVVYAAKIDKAEARIDFSRAATEVVHLIHGLSPFPGAFIEVRKDGKAERIKVLRAEPAAGSGPPGTALDDQLRIACGSGAVRLLELQRAGKKPMRASELLRGYSLPAGAVVSATPVKHG